jgi:hypothetical protein
MIEVVKFDLFAVYIDEFSYDVIFQKIKSYCSKKQKNKSKLIKIIFNY